MWRENVEVVRQPIVLSARSRRRLEERLALRFPRAGSFLARMIWRLPKRSRLRRALVRRTVKLGWESFNRGDLDAAFVLWHPDCQSTFPPEGTTIGIESGSRSRDERIRLQQRYIDEWDEFRFELEELIDFGDGRLMTVGRMKFTGLRSGAAVDTEWDTLFTTFDGRVVREQIFADRAQALEAAGLSE